ncbi:TPA: nucleotidyl transferase AbiEii/AbiGii toxin family protein [Candidatus Micrarchaeota archaeon]|nr:nucleotidyl transferase AbiEii/AbiGii toxin family protein [Candidatus Micrarchaeota archaeon]
MIIPLHKRLRKRMHTEIALLQDELIELLYAIDNRLVLHGGTAIWRCYGGNRFSEDLNFYCKDTHRIEKFFIEKVKEQNLEVLKFKKTENLIFCKVSNGNTIARVEINFAAGKKAIASPYERTDGTFMDVLTLTEGKLILEKMEAYKNRRFIRDMYDIYHLSNYTQADSKVMRKFLDSIPQPVDEKNLKTLVYSGAIPTFRQMLDSLKRRFG